MSDHTDPRYSDKRYVQTLTFNAGVDTTTPTLSVELRETSRDVNKTSYSLVFKADSREELDRALMRLYYKITEHIYED